MNVFSLDNIIYKLFNKKWKIEEEEIDIPTFSPPKLWKLKFLDYVDENNNQLILYKYPNHYRHKILFQYDSGFMIYFSLLGGGSLIYSINQLFKKKYKSGILFSFFSFFTFLEGVLITSRVRDPKLITLRNGKILCIKTFQDGEMEYQFDIKDLRLVNKDKTNLLVLIDANAAKQNKFLFFFIEPTPGLVSNFELFSTVMIDKRYLSYENHKNRIDIYKF